MAKYGYARVSSVDQDCAIQVDALQKSGCEIIRQEKVSARNVDDRPELKTLLRLFVEMGALARDVPIAPTLRQSVVKLVMKTHPETAGAPVDIKKYDYMVFGLVDVRISFTSENSSGPDVSSATPVGTVKHDYATLSVETDKAAPCKFDRDDVEYKDMSYTFGTTGAKTHEQKVCELDDGNFTWYVRCKNASGGEVNDASTLIQFETSN